MSRAQPIGRVARAGLAPAAALVALLLLLTAPARAITIDRVVSPGGIEAWLVQDHTLPVVTIELSFRGGAATDPDGKGGLANMTASLLDEGAGPLDSQAFQGRLEDLAGGVRFGASQDFFTGSLSSLKANLGASLELLRLALTQPRFDAEPVARVRGDLIASLAQRAQRPSAIASRVWWHHAFADHPYGRSSEGTEQSLATITAEDMKRFIGDRLARDVLTLGIVGDVTPDEVKALLDGTFGALPAKAAPGAVPNADATGDAGALLLVKRPIPQSVATFGEPGLKRNDPDWYAALLDNYILGGGGFSSRLMEEVRVKRGLAYGVSTSLYPLQEGAVILGSVATQNSRVAQSIAIIRQEWQRMHDAGPDAEELAGAKTYLTGSFPIQFDSTGRIAETLVLIQQDHLGIDYLDKRNSYIEAVTLETARRVAGRLFDPAALGFAIVGMPSDLTPTREVAPDGG